MDLVVTEPGGKNVSDNEGRIGVRVEAYLACWPAVAAVDVPRQEHVSMEWFATAA